MDNSVISIACYFAGTVAFAIIIQKAGYSGWWILLALIPCVNLVMLVVFAGAEWPIHRELSLQRILADNALDADYDSVAALATAADRRGDWVEALHLFELLGATCENMETKGYADSMMQDLKNKLRSQEIPQNPYTADAKLPT